MKKLILFFMSSVAVATLLASCEKTYTCNCMIQNTDGSTESLVGEPVFITFSSKTKQGANIECAKGNQPWANAKGEPAAITCSADRL